MSVDRKSEQALSMKLFPGCDTWQMFLYEQGRKEPEKNNANIDFNLPHEEIIIQTTADYKN